MENNPKERMIELPLKPYEGIVEMNKYLKMMRGWLNETAKDILGKEDYKEMLQLSSIVDETCDIIIARLSPRSSRVDLVEAFNFLKELLKKQEETKKLVTTSKLYKVERVEENEIMKGKTAMDRYKKKIEDKKGEIDDKTGDR